VCHLCQLCPGLCQVAYPHALEEAWLLRYYSACPPNRTGPGPLHGSHFLRALPPLNVLPACAHGFLAFQGQQVLAGNES
jgi:hypothetical protein